MCITTIGAQEAYYYRPFVEDGKRWLFSQDDLEVTYWFDGDTVVCGQTCYKMWNAENVIPYYKYYDGNFFEKDRRVYFFYLPLWQEGDGDIGTVRHDSLRLEEPRLFMDFNAIPGDTLEIWRPHFRGIQHSDTVLVTHRDTMEVNGRPVTCISFTNLTLTPSPKANPDWGVSLNFWAEGIGPGITFNRHADGNTRWAYNLIMRSCSLADGQTLYDEADSLAWVLDRLHYDGYHYPDEDAIPIVKQTVNKKSPNSQCYDLTGRRLAAPPARGLYIEDGRLRVKH